MERPIACTLSETEMRERRLAIQEAIRARAIDVTQLPDGYAYSFQAASECLMQLSRLVDLERQCCQFLTFRIIVEAGEAPIRLEITGPAEARSIIAVFFGGAE